MMEISIFNTYIHKDAFKNVERVLNSTFISEGKLVKEFESRLAAEFGLLNPVALNSGTTALHLALDIAGVGEGDEVILPAQTFVATGLVILQQKAVPVFADIDYETGNISVESIKQKITYRTKAVVPVHWGGYPCDLDEINEVARKENIVVIEDAAHALGATYKNQSIGAVSDLTCFSFQAIKHLTTGDGGALACRENELAKAAFTKRWFGIDRDNAPQSFLGERQYNIEALGYKYHLNDYAAALGLANMEDYFQRLNRRHEIAARYNKELANITGLSLWKYNADRKSAYWLFGFHVDKREEFIKMMKSKGVIASVIHQRIDRNKVFGSKQDLPCQEEFDKTQIHIPLHDSLTDENVEYIIQQIKNGW